MLRFFIIFLQKLGWSIRFKIGLAFILILSCFIINGLVSASLLFTIKAAEEKQATNSLNLERLQRIELAYKSQLDLYGDAIFFIKAPYLQDRFKEPILASFLDKNETHNDIITREFEKSFADLYGITFGHFSQLEEWIEAGKFDQAAKEWKTFTPDFDTVTLLLSTRHKQLNSDSTLREQEVASTIFLAVSILVISTAISIILALLMLNLFDQVLVAPIQKLGSGLEEIARGNLDHRIEITNRDELGKLASAFRKAVLSLQQVIRGVQIGEDLTVVTGQLAVISKEQASGAKDQVSALVQVSASMQELSLTAAHIAERAAEVSGLTASTLEQIELAALVGNLSRNCAQEMIVVVGNALNGIERIGQQVEEFNRQMDELAMRSEGISKVVSLLNTISSEVRLLAINAAMEASSAGVYGERFKEVAREIKRLSAKTNDATIEASNLIKAVQVSSRVAQSQVAEGKQEVISIVTTNTQMRQSLQELDYSVQRVSHTFTKLLTLANQVNLQTDEIKQATYQQRIASEQVIVAASMVGVVASHNADMSFNVSANTTHLETLTRQLNGVLAQVSIT